MIAKTLLPVMHPLMPKELPLELQVIEGRICSIHTSLNDEQVDFIRDEDGEFTIETTYSIDQSQVSYLQRQLNRIYGN